MLSRTALLGVLLLAGLTGRARADDKAGCADPAWAPKRLPGFTIDDCDHKAWQSVHMDLAAGGKVAAGEVWSVSYNLADEKQDPAAKKARDFYVNLWGRTGKVVSDPTDGYSVIVEQKTAKGDDYYEYDHGGGNEESTTAYTVTRLHVEPLVQHVVAKRPAAPLDASGKTCKDPAWLVKGYPGFKLAKCDPRDFDQLTFDTKDGQKTLAGRILDHDYQLVDPAQDPVAEAVQKNFVAALEKIGAKLVTQPDDVFNAVLEQKTPQGELWYIYAHTSGNDNSTTSYELTTIEVGGPPAKGCKLEIYGVHFDTDKSTLRPDSEPVLDQVLALLKAEPRLTGDLSGHTDDTGAKEYNLKLSQARAAAVKAWLVAHGVAAARLTTHGYGDTRPLVPNDSDEHRAKNRRVELVRDHCKG